MAINKEIILGVKGIFIKNGKLLIIQRSTQGTGGGSWECPGGKIEFGEKMETALIREFKEETDLDIQPAELLYPTTFMSSGTRQIVLLCYRVHGGDGQVVLSHEHTDFCWADEKELRNRLPRHIINEFDHYNIFSLLEANEDRGR